MSIEGRDNREAPGIDIRRVLWPVGGFVLVVALATAGLGLLYRQRLNPGRTPAVLTTFPMPQIQPNPRQDYLGFRRRQQAQLAGYAWVDRRKSLIHIPIERAMAFIVARGKAALDPIASAPDAAAPQPPPGGGAPDGAPRARPTLAASPYGSRP